MELRVLGPLEATDGETPLALELYERHGASALWRERVQRRRATLAEPAAP
jgi:hypothetical protein